MPLLTGLALAFVATLVFCFARAPWVLVVARVFQGFSASIIYTAGLALIADTVPAEEVGSWYVAVPCLEISDRSVIEDKIGWALYSVV